MTHLECLQKLPLLDDDFDARRDENQQTRMIVQQIQEDNDGRRTSVKDGGSDDE